MGNYLGVKCPVCSKRFAQADDVVVCPLCGAPHHRHCYAEKGECVFAADHISGKEWRPPACEATEDAGSKEQGTKACGRCGSASPMYALFCQICGQSLGGQAGSSGSAGQQSGHKINPGEPHQAAYWYPPYDPGSQGGKTKDPYSGVDAAQTIGKLAAKDIAVFVGPNYSYFLNRFRQIENEGRNIQPNLSAMLFNFFYYFYRRMYMVGAGMLLAFVACLIPFFLFSWEIMPYVLGNLGLAGPPEVPVNMQAAEAYSGILVLALFLNFVFSVIVSLFANRMYHKHVVAKISQTINESRNGVDYRVLLPRVGGVDWLSVVLLGVLLVIGSNVVLSVMIFNSNLLS